MECFTCFVLLAYLKMSFYYVDTYDNVNECISKAEILFKGERSKYMCLPNNELNQQRIVKGVFHRGLLKNNK